MDRVIKGSTNPEGNTEAPLGTFYIDVKTLSLYIKLAGNESTSSGWYALNAKGFYEGDDDPNNIVSAPKYAYYLDNLTDDLYIQLTQSASLSTTGWQCVTQGQVLTGEKTPTDETSQGDLYINTLSTLLYVYTDHGWELVSLVTVSSSEILSNLSELLTNTTAIIDQYFNIFFNPTPMDVSLAQYDSNGLLNTYSIPNRAKDVKVETGTVNPEGALAYAMGKIYVNTTTGIPYIKVTDESSSTGWRPLYVRAELPLVYDTTNMKFTVQIDSQPTANSNSLVTSGVIYAALAQKAGKEGDADSNFLAAEPALDSHVATKKYVDDAIAAAIAKLSS